MQDKTINNALLALRKQIIRANGDGLAHVEAMLVMRGVHMPAVLPTKLPDVAGKGIVAYLIIQALRGGPKRMSEVAAYVDLKRPEFDFQAANIRTGQALAKLKLKGQVTREGRLWMLHVVQDFGPGGCLWRIQRS